MPVPYLHVGSAFPPVELYKALSPEGNLEIATVPKVVKALGLSLRAMIG